jgi:hypothetical protein
MYLYNPHISPGAQPRAVPLRKIGGGGRAQLTTHLHRMSTLRMAEQYLHFLIRLHGVVLN